MLFLICFNLLVRVWGMLILVGIVLLLVGMVRVGMVRLCVLMVVWKVDVVLLL